jgi:hypothetical protein
MRQFDEDVERTSSPPRVVPRILRVVGLPVVVGR